MKLSNLIAGGLLLGLMPALVHAQEPAKTEAAASAPAARVTCDDLKKRIASQIEGHGVKQYTLEIADAASPGEGKVVANCEGGKKAIVYSKGGAAKADSKADSGK